jgi:hypothetical protein
LKAFGFNPVRFIDAFVDELDLAAAGLLRVEPKGTGRPGYAPGDLLKLYRVRSIRVLCFRGTEGCISSVKWF